MNAIDRRVLTIMLAAVATAGVAGGVAASRRDAVDPAAAVTNVKILGSKTVKQTATGAGAKSTVLTVGTLSFRAVCTDLGAGSYRSELQAKSTAAGATALSMNGNLPLNAAYQTFWNAQNSGPGSYSLPFDVLTTSGTFRHFASIVSVHSFGADCLVRLTAYSG